MASQKMLPNIWRSWVAENVLLDMTPEQIEQHAVSAGMKRSLIREELKRAQHSPYIEGGRWLAQRMNKLESMLRVRVEVARQNKPRLSVPSRRRLSAETFREKYYAHNRPVKLLDMLEDWPAMQKWTPEYFRDVYGDEMVEITAARNGDAKYEINLEDHRRTVQFKSFIDQVVSTFGNDSYLVANNKFFQQPGMKSLMSDIGPLPGILTRKKRIPHTYLWFGPGGTVTPLHHDTMNILFCQIYGSKQITLISPDETPWLYNEISVYSEVDFENPDLESYPLFQHVDQIEVVVNPGEVLFIPVGWWHHVRSLETSISVSFTNFEFPNDYEWRHPEIRR
ncbi:MAG: cupin-like domain-containing protein [Acidobacteriaceae bacterium]